jgi:hypothetical protein
VSVFAPAGLQVGDLVVQQMWSPTDPRWSSTIQERIEHGHRYGADRMMRVAGITAHDLGADEQWRTTTGFIGPLRPRVRWWLVDPERPRDESRMSWVESDWCVLKPVTEDGALF